ncbi:MAG: 5-formyltetrahydrofolate cyclo-ligase [Chitinophagaceae bacterium]
MTKTALREMYKQKRSALPEEERLRLNDLLLIQFQQMEIPYGVNILLSYWPLEQHAEINTFLMTDYLQFRMPELQIAYPVANFEDTYIKAVLVNDDTDFKKNRYGIAEPVNGLEITAADIDLVFVPLLVFDRDGYRLGYGKGFYDRFLPGCREDSIKVGFSYFEPVASIDDINQFDVPLTTGITPENIYEF